MESDWSDLSAILARKEYNVAKDDRDDPAIAPHDALECRCDPPGLSLDRDDGEVRCWKCGARSAAAACRS